MGMNVSGRGGTVSGDINITPLIDVVLVLLIIFMVLVPATVKQLTATIPRKEQQQDPDPQTPPQIVLKVGPEGQLTLGETPVPPADLRAIIGKRLESASQKVVFFDVDDDARYGAVVRYMDIVRGAGARTLGIVTRD
jgi:biopolymer transport protein TolR